MTPPSVRVAVLDDYANVAHRYLSKISGIEITSFPDTIVPSDDTALGALAARLHPFPVILSMRERTPFQAPLLARLPNLTLLVTTGTRNQGIDVKAAHAANITVAGTTGARQLPVDRYGPLPEITRDYDATTQQCFSLLLSLTSRIPIDNYALRTKPGVWQSGLGFTLGGKVFGCVGFGRLGAKAARTAVLGFGMRVVAWSTNLDARTADEKAEALGLPRGTVKVVGKEELLRTADVVSIHYLLSDRSRGLIGKEELGMMQKHAVLVNTSRGPIVDESALLDVLERGAIRGAALDVFDVEPLPNDSPWRTTKWGEDGRAEVVLSPHMGYGVEETMHRWYAEQADTVERWLQGKELPDLLT